MGIVLPPNIPYRDGAHYPVLATFAGTTFTPWSSEAVIYQHCPISPPSQGSNPGIPNRRWEWCPFGHHGLHELMSWVKFMIHMGSTFVSELVQWNHYINLRNNEINKKIVTHLGILNRALIGWQSAIGGSPSASSIAVTPSDHTSQRTS